MPILPPQFPDWETLYNELPASNMPWFHAALDPDLEAALQERGVTGGRALDLGTGPGTQAVELAARGFHVTATDISRAAVAGARELAAARGVAVEFIVDDVLASRLTGRFDLVFDRGCFHVMDPADRPAYVATVAGLLPPGGLLVLKTFSKLQPEGPGPHRFSIVELCEVFAGAFDLCSAHETIYHGQLATPPRALLSVFERREP
jgi:cyclopropane fatty-acyl-phospholipid synthase-like methyltransferase